MTEEKERVEELDEFYDHSEIVKEKIMPLWKEIWETCKENNIPVIFAVCSSKTNEGDKSNFEMMRGCYIDGRITPDAMIIGEKVIGREVTPVSGSKLFAGAMAGVMASLSSEDDCDCESCDSKDCEKE